MPGQAESRYTRTARPEQEAPAAIYPVIDGIFDGDRLAAPAPKKGPGAQRLPVLSCTTVYPLLQTCQCTLLTRFTRRFWRKSGAKLQPFFQPHKFFTHFFSKKFSLKKKSATACVITPRCAKQCARPKSRRDAWRVEDRRSAGTCHGISVITPIIPGVSLRRAVTDVTVTSLQLLAGLRRRSVGTCRDQEVKNKGER